MTSSVSPRLSIAKPPANARPNGVLSIAPSATQQRNAANIQRSVMAPKAPAARLKVVIRRLPPGLTQAEFETVLGDEWKLHGGKVDWSLYKEGRVSKE